MQYHAEHPNAHMSELPKQITRCTDLFLLTLANAHAQRGPHAHPLRASRAPLSPG